MFSITEFRDTPYIRGFVFTGQMYHVEKFFTVGAGQSKWIQLTTPSDMLIHGINRSLTPDVGDMYFRLFEGVTITTPGTPAIPIYNLNRNSTNTSSAVFLSEPVVTGGTMIEEVYMPGQYTNPSTYTPIFGSIEREYKKDTEYAIQFYNQAATAANIQYSFAFYESSN